MGTIGIMLALSFAFYNNKSNQTLTQNKKDGIIASPRRKNNRKRGRESSLLRGLIETNHSIDWGFCFTSEQRSDSLRQTRVEDQEAEEVMANPSYFINPNPSYFIREETSEYDCTRGGMRGKRRPHRHSTVMAPRRESSLGGSGAVLVRAPGAFVYPCTAPCLQTRVQISRYAKGCSYWTARIGVHHEMDG